MGLIHGARDNSSVANGEHMQAASHLVPLRVYLTIFSLLMVSRRDGRVSYLISDPSTPSSHRHRRHQMMLSSVLHARPVQHPLTWAVVAGGFFWLALLLLLTSATT